MYKVWQKSQKSLKYAYIKYDYAVTTAYLFTL